MKKLLLLLTFTTTIIQFINAQFFTGLRSSPYGGVTNVGWSPAIADAPFVADVNLIGMAANFNNNYVGVDRNLLLKKDYKGNNTGDFQADFLKERVNGHDKSVYMGMQVQGPLSFMCTWGKGENKNKNAFAFTWNVNTVFNMDRVDETFARIAYHGEGFQADSILHYLDKGLNNGNISARAMVWADYGLTYSRVVYDEGDHFIKVGGTLKFIQGIAGAYAYVKDLKYQWHNYDYLSVFQTQAHYAYSQGFISSKGYPVTDISSFAKNLVSFTYAYPSFAGDLGLTYEWRPKKDKYKYK